MTTGGATCTESRRGFVVPRHAYDEEGICERCGQSKDSTAGGRPRGGSVETDEQGLTARQREVLDLLESGLNQRQVGLALEISRQAVHGIVRILRSKGLVK